MVLVERDGTLSTIGDKRTKVQNFFGFFQHLVYKDVFISTFKEAIDFVEERWVSDKHRTYDSLEERKEAIENYCDTQGIDIYSSVKPYYKYKTINDFFTRKIKPELTPYLNKLADKRRTAISSMADSRVVCFQNIKNAKKIWIKGNLFNVKSFVGCDYIDEYRFSTIMINRLAPVDYHRYHCPCDLKVLSIHNIEAHYKLASLPVTIASVTSPIANPFSRNTRVIVECQHCHTGNKFLIVLIGALGVNTISHVFKIGKQYKKFEDVGCFEVGGSTIVLLFPKATSRVHSDILENSSNKNETYIRVGETVSEFV